MKEAMVPPRQIIPIEGTYMLDGTKIGKDPHHEVLKIIHQFGLVPFIQELAGEIKAVYTEPCIARNNRDNMFASTGGESGYATFETMMARGSDYAVFKEIGSDPDNRKQGLATVWGRMMCIESATNHMRLMCDASIPTMLRTATTAALTIDTLKPELETLSVIGAGMQGQAAILSGAILIPSLRSILVRDLYQDQAEQAAEDLGTVIEDVLGKERAATITIETSQEKDRRIEEESDAIITATLGLPDQPPAMASPKLRPGVVIAAIGADMVGKRELDPRIYHHAKFVTDELSQSLREGELQHAIKQNGMRPRPVKHENVTSFHGSLLRGRIIGITELLQDPKTFIDRPELVTIYDSTGFAGQDLAAGRLLLRILTQMKYPLDPPFNGPSDPEERRRQFFAALSGRDEPEPQEK